MAKDDELAVARMPSEGYAPLSAQQRSRIAEMIVHAQAAESEPEKPRPSTGGVVSLDRRRRSSRRFVAIVLAPLAAAAALVLVIRPFSAPAPLPEYAVAARGGIKEMRGAEAAPPPAAGSVAAAQRLRPESRLVIVASPGSAVAGPVAIRAFVVQGERTEEVWPQAQIAPSGAVEIRAPVAEVFGARTGQWNLVLLIGRPQALRAIEPSSAFTRSPDPAWRRLIVPLQLEAP